MNTKTSAYTCFFSPKTGGDTEGGDTEGVENLPSRAAPTF